MDRDHATLARTMRNVPSIHLLFDDEVFALPAEAEAVGGEGAVMVDRAKRWAGVEGDDEDAGNANIYAIYSCQVKSVS